MFNSNWPAHHSILIVILIALVINFSFDIGLVLCSLDCGNKSLFVK